MAKKSKKTVGFFSIILVIVTGLVIFAVLRLVLFWVWKLFFLLICIAIAYFILQSLGLFGEDDDDD